MTSGALHRLSAGLFRWEATTQPFTLQSLMCHVFPPEKRNFQIPVCKCQCTSDHKSWALIFQSWVYGRSPNYYYSTVHSLHSSSWLTVASCAMLQNKHRCRVCADDLGGWPHARSGGYKQDHKKYLTHEGYTPSKRICLIFRVQRLFGIQAHVIVITRLVILHTLQTTTFSACRSAGFSGGLSIFSGRFSTTFSGGFSIFFVLCRKIDKQCWPQKCK